MNVNGYSIEKWEFSTGGQIAFGNRGGKKYFLKKYQTPVKPVENTEGMSETRYRKAVERFDRFIEFRNLINNTLSTISGPGGCIIVPSESFIYEQRFVEVTEFVEGIISQDELKHVSYEDRLTILMLASKALADVHSKNIIHGDLKPTNVVVTKSTSGMYKAKLIDFDSSYFYKTDKTYRGDIGGDQIYMAPEVGCYITSEFSEEFAVMLSPAADIFSIGIVLHEFACSELPKIKVCPEGCKDPYIWETIAFGGSVEVSSKIKDDYVKKLISSMIDPDYKKRPTAMEVFEGLKSKRWPLSAPTTHSTPVAPPRPTPVSEPVVAGSYDEPWPEHHVVINRSEIDKQKIISFKRIKVGSTSGYEAHYSDGKSRKANVNTWISFGVLVLESTPTVAATPVSAPENSERTIVEPAVDGELWPEDSAYTLITSAYQADGFSKIVPAEVNGMHCYALYVGDVVKQYKKLNHLINMGYIRRG